MQLMEKNVNFQLRLEHDLHVALTELAKTYRRSLNAEINTRLRKSVEAEHAQPWSAVAQLQREVVFSGQLAGEPIKDYRDTEYRVLEIFRRMTPEKQMALLALFS